MKNVNDALDHFRIRYRGFEQHMTDEEKQSCRLMVDEWDFGINVDHLNIDRKAAIRIHQGGLSLPTPLVENFNWMPDDKEWVEASRFCVAPDVTLGEKMRLIARLFRLLLETTGPQVLYTTAAPQLSRVYRSVIGFKPVAELKPIVIPPTKEPLELLRLDLSREVAYKKAFDRL